ncbi:MAG: ABC transporter permease [Erysipelothrix sp.]|jgi:peptide/nickel transport system permease protein|nr:ABC transporter permease [Erysipelothrix sp.]
MIRYAIKRILLVIPVLIAITFIIFSLLHFSGDPARVILGEQASGDQIERLREEMGLNDPFLVQYGRYAKRVFVDFDLGRSYVTKRSVNDEIKVRYPKTLTLALSGIVVAIFIGVPLGVISATKQNSIADNISMFLALIGVSMPVFWKGILFMLLFSLTLKWLPTSGYGTWQQMILPAISLGLGSAAIIARMTRSSMLEVYRQDFIRTARAKGVREFFVVNRHALRNALIPVITVIGLQFGYLLGGAVITETIFSIPGIGKWIVDGISKRDMVVVQGGVLLIAMTFSIINLVVDLVYGFLDPKIREQYK